MTRRARLAAFIALLTLGALGVGFAIYRATRAPEATAPSTLPPAPPHAAALDAVPSGAMLVLTVDLAHLRASPLASATEGPARATWLGDVRATCGFDPLESLSELALVVPGGADDDLGIVGAGDFDSDAIAACANKIISARGGRPSTSSLGSFNSIRDTDHSKKTGEIAVKRGGPLLVSGGELMRSLVDTADGRAPSVRADQAHAALRTAVGDDAVIRLSIVLSEEQRATIADEVAHSGGRAPAALVSIVAAGLGLRVTSETVQLHAVVLLSDAAAAAKFQAALDELRRTRAQDPALRAFGVSALLDRIQSKVDGAAVHLTLALTIVEAQNLIERWTAPEPKAPAPTDVPTEPPPPERSASAAPSASSAPSAAPSASAKKKPAKGAPPKAAPAKSAPKDAP